MARRIKYNRGDVGETVRAALVICQDGAPRFVYATAHGLTISKTKIPWQSFWYVSQETVRFFDYSPVTGKHTLEREYSPRQAEYVDLG